MRNRESRRGTRPAIEGRELRLIQIRPEIRAAGDGQDGAIPFRGEAIVYDTWTAIPDWWFGEFQERIAPGAASASIAVDDIRLLINHDPNLVLARRRGDGADTLRFLDGAESLGVEAELAPTSYGRDLALSLERGDVSGMSFAFEALDEDWAERPDGTWQRTITRLRLYDVSIVTYPAYPETEAGLRTAGLRSLLGDVFGQPSARFRELVASRAGRRNSAADEGVIRSAVDGLRAHADELESLIAEATEEESNDDDQADDDSRAARTQAIRHAAFGALHGLTPAR